MIVTGKRSVDNSRVGHALALLESSSYVDPWREELRESINGAGIDEIEAIIQELLVNQK